MKELKPLMDALQTIRLTDEEKKVGRNALLQFMDRNPMVKKASLWERFYSRARRPVMATSAVFMVLLISTGGVAYASESSLPGDALYSFKVNVVEEVQGALQFSPEAKADWQIERMQRRFEEAETLSDRGQLDEKAQVELAHQLTFSSKEIHKQIRDLQEKGEEKAEQIQEIQSNFKGVVNNHPNKTKELRHKFREEWKREHPLNDTLLQVEEESSEENEEKIEENPKLTPEITESTEDATETTDPNENSQETEVDVEVEVETEVESSPLQPLDFTPSPNL